MHSRFHCCSNRTGLEAGAEEEAGRGSGQEDDLDAHLNLYVWIHQ